MEPQIFIFGLFLLAIIEAVTIDQKSSLAFVIDDTGSMQVDVHELNKTATSIFDKVNSNASPFDDFIVVTFNDPEVKLRNAEHSKSDFETALSDIEPRGGGNCAEMSLSGIQLGLEKSRAGSHLWVFTDASAADMEKYYKIEELSQKMGSQVYFVVTGLCDNRTNPDFLVYRDLAMATNGQVFHSRKNEIGQIFNYVELLIEDRKDIVRSTFFPAGGLNQLYVNVDGDMEELIIAVSGENPVVTVTSSRGVLTTTEVTRLGEIAVVIVNVEAGVYKVAVTSNSETHVVVSASTSVHFEHGFSVFSSSNINGTTRKPVPETQSHLSIQLAAEDPEVFDVHSVQILDMDDNVILEEPLELVNKFTQFYTTKKITPPDQMFKVAVKMYDTLHKSYITRHGLTPIRAQNKTTGDHTEKAPVVTIVGGPIINAAYYHPLQLRCKIKGYPTPSVIWTSSDKSANLTYDKQVSIFELPEDYISVLDISEVKNNATYTCSAINNIASNKARVFVQTKVVIVATPIELPDNATIEYLKSGRIACKVETFPLAKVSWHKNGKPLKPDGNLEVSKDGSVLTIRSMELYMDDSYNCSVENALLKKVYPFKLSISGLEPPTIKKINPNKIVMKNSKAELKCPVIGGIPVPSISWFYKNVTASEFTDFIKNIDTIHFDKVNVTNAGSYICLAENIVGSDSIQYELNVLGKCEQPMKQGPCPSAIPRWYYDKNLNECRRFSYGGCQGNENNFESESVCRNECPATGEPGPLGKCEQPMKQGPCTSAFSRWYYDKNHNECRRFSYGGCQGNENNFESESVCRNECPATGEPGPLGKCEQPMKQGPCTSTIPRWYYDKILNECRRFSYGGCQGNENNFESESVCRNECPATEEPGPLGKCEQPMKQGPCTSTIPRWYYDKILNECRRFSYGGCQGNENNFESESVCRNECPATEEPGPLRKCEQPMKQGPCTSAIPMWYYDKNLNECRRFSYGGCLGNENNFDSESACRSECSTIVTTLSPPIGKCEQPMKQGPCPSAIPRWYYDKNLNECRIFSYGGCLGNENNFDSESACRSECSTIVTTLSPPIGKCEQPMKQGPCTSAIPRWYYDKNLNECRIFSYGGCQGNENNFDSESACRNECSATVTRQPPPLGKCEQPMKQGPCTSAYPRWYYDKNLNECRIFSYGGCQGNENNFDSESACRNECSATVTRKPPPGKCEQPMKQGPCTYAIQRWYYDKNLNECRIFSYGGCLGNENNFDSESACRSECSTIVTTLSPPIGKCEQPMKQGPCTYAIQRWYYDKNLNECRIFSYGGCLGNENNFDSESACRSECSTIVTTLSPPIGKCEQPMKQGPCPSAYPRWYYDKNLNECRIFSYGGCQGNENNFDTESACRNECSATVTRQQPPLGCLLDIKRDLNGNVPLMFTQDDEFTNFESNKGYLEIPVNQTIKLVCPVKFYKLHLKEIIVTCESKKQFRHLPSGRLYGYSDLKCTDQWQYKNIKTGRQCLNGDSELLNVGFEIRGRFQEIYQVCLNRITNNPFYVKHNLVQAPPNAVSNKYTPWFDSEDSVDLDVTFDCVAQNEEISRTLNKEFRNDGCCFAKRMLVNPLDVTPGSAQDATYSYLNIAPHWSSCNSQNWEAIEQRIRDLRKQSRRPLQVWTGVAQHLQIADASSELQHITLSQNGKQFQVPKYFWKVVQDSGTKAALAIVQLNIPDLQLKDARKHVLCTDVCRKTTWMNSRHWRNPARGYTFCCELDKFKSAFQLEYYGVLPTSQDLLLGATTLPNLVV